MIYVVTGPQGSGKAEVAQTLMQGLVEAGTVVTLSRNRLIGDFERGCALAGGPTGAIVDLEGPLTNVFARHLVEIFGGRRTMIHRKYMANVTIPTPVVVVIATKAPDDLPIDRFKEIRVPR